MTCLKCQISYTKEGVKIISPSEFANLELCCAGNCLIKRNAPVNSGTLSGSGLPFLLLLSIGLSRMLKSCSPRSNPFFQSSPLYFKLLSDLCDSLFATKIKGKNTYCLSPVKGEPTENSIGIGESICFAATMGTQMMACSLLVAGAQVSPKRRLPEFI
uniref:Uncharacterized protein n=1 Tax=Meloidogyne enterolobii TaxID=390850 RepID=A0A6V7XWC0_MELEN|nr:unnamed protein product [Meloidogyne enterolobii]